MVELNEEAKEVFAFANRKAEYIINNLSTLEGFKTLAIVSALEGLAKTIAENTAEMKNIKEKKLGIHSGLADFEGRF